MTPIPIKLKRQLLDIFQHCELCCIADCCGWQAFDLSEHWLNRWCEFRDVNDVDSALAEIAELNSKLADRDQTDVVSIERFFKLTVAELSQQIHHVENALAAY